MVIIVLHWKNGAAACNWMKYMIDLLWTVFSGIEIILFVRIVCVFVSTSLQADMQDRCDDISGTADQTETEAI